jgi:hypothetical protein
MQSRWVIHVEGGNIPLPRFLGGNALEAAMRLLGSVG